MRQWMPARVIAFTLTASPASAAYFTSENTWPDGDTWTSENLRRFSNVWLTVFDSVATKYDVLIISSDYVHKKPLTRRRRVRP